MAKVRIKPGVQPRVADILAAIGNVAARLKAPDEVWITSVIDGYHSANSLHYALRAVDVRTKNFPTQASKEEFRELVKVELGPKYDVLLEGIGTPNEHLHVEFDP